MTEKNGVIEEELVINDDMLECKEVCKNLNQVNLNQQIKLIF